MSVEILPPRILFDGVTGIAHYETMRSTRVGDVKASKQHGARRRAVERMPRWA